MGQAPGLALGVLRFGHEVCKKNGMCIFLINLYVTDLLYTQFLNKEPMVWPHGPLASGSLHTPAHAQLVCQSGYGP